jgi:cell division protease FtsH
VRGGLCLNRFFKGLVLYLVIGFVFLSILTMLFPPVTKRPENIDYTTFRELVDEGLVEQVTIVDRQITGELVTGEVFKTYNPGDSFLVNILTESGVRVEGKASSSWWTLIIPNLVVIVIFIVFWLFMLNQLQGGSNKAMSFGKSRAKLHMEGKIKVTFDDVAGLDEAKQELMEVVEFLKNPRKFVELGAKIPKGVLLVGPPGTGKTLLGRAVAGEAGVAFFSISGSDFVEMFVGVGASRVRDLFAAAKKNAPCIVFVDEIDAVGRQRGAGLGGGHDEREQTLNQLLVEMDGFEPNIGIILLAATNRPDVLDPALLRPGRFDRQVMVDIPDIRGREAILKVHAKGKPLADDVDLNVLARRTVGFTGADLANVLNEAALLAARRGARKISMSECEEAIEKVIAGPEKKSRVMSEHEKNLTAYHEAGHAVVGVFLPHTNPVHKVTIVPRGRAGGYTLMLPKEDKYYASRSELLAQVSVLLAGRAAEELVLNEISTGAANDLERATKLVHMMICEWGMSAELGPRTFGRGHEDTVFLGRDFSRGRDYSEEIAAAIDKEERRIIDECYERAYNLLKEKREIMEKVVGALREKETLEADEFREIVGLPPEEDEEEAAKDSVLEAEAKDTTEVKNEIKDEAATGDNPGDNLIEPAPSGEEKENEE